MSVLLQCVLQRVLQCVLQCEGKEAGDVCYEAGIFEGALGNECIVASLWQCVLQCVLQCV